MKIIDITPLLTIASPVYPGDAPLSLEFFQSEKLCVGTFTMSAHLGAHVDAPKHLNRAGDVSTIAPKRLIGPCQVIEIKTSGEITADQLVGVHSCRVLIKTGFKIPAQWSDSFAYLSAEAICRLLDQGVTVIGIDTPSIDCASDEKLTSHVLAIDGGAIILENLELSAVRAGDYELIALPLKIKGLEASPVRRLVSRRDAIALGRYVNKKCSDSGRFGAIGLF